MHFDYDEDSERRGVGQEGMCVDFGQKSSRGDEDNGTSRSYWKRTTQYLRYLEVIPFEPDAFLHGLYHGCAGGYHNTTR